ncbi:uncharacterized protein LOC100901994 [Galendromus occidentalis]|uniref:Uncharacterized protein LOC100901994 n=1 Tax=Galendromus occidentalis TaxID=34638 RepID=A0AAJ6QYP9_9ACAR|nr:uncharacterized protein LOC100901994 [Galendromus occidentalis]
MLLRSALLGSLLLHLTLGAAVCDEEKFDQVAGTLLLYSTTSNTQPVDKAGLEASCMSDNKTFEWIEDYTRTCIKGVAGGVMRLLLDSSGEELHGRCYGEKQTEYLKHTPCWNTASAELSACNKEMTALMEAAVKLEKRQHLLAHSCCSIQTYSKCMETRARAKCPEEAAEFLKDMVYRIGENLLDGPCGKFTPESKECTELPKPMIPKKLKYRSFVPAMINVLNHYG